MFSITAKDLRAILHGVPDDAPLLLRAIGEDRALIESSAKYVTSAKDAPHVSLKENINTINKNGAIVISCFVF